MPVFAKGAYAGDLEVLDALSLRFLIAAGALWGYALLRRDVPLLLPLRLLGALAVLGAGIYGPLAICFFLSVQRLSASLAEMLFFTYPLLVTVLKQCAAVTQGNRRLRQRVIYKSCMQQPGL